MCSGGTLMYLNKMRYRSEILVDLLVSQINFDIQLQFVRTLINSNETCIYLPTLFYYLIELTLFLLSFFTFSK